MNSLVQSGEDALLPTAQTDGPAPSWEDAVLADGRLAAFYPDAEGASIVCALHGHAAVESGFMGEWGCERCGAVVGDSLMGSHVPPVIRNHDCDTCRSGWAAATFWQRLGVEPDGSGFFQKPDAF